MTDQLDVLALVTSTLDAAGIPYMVTGAMGSGYCGEPRMTRDADLASSCAQTILTGSNRCSASRSC